MFLLVFFFFFRSFVVDFNLSFFFFPLSISLLFSFFSFVVLIWQQGLPPHFDVLLSLCDESGHFSIDAPPSFSNPGVVSPVSGEKAGSSDLPILSEHARQELSSVASRLLVIHMLNQFTCPLEKLHLISLFIQCVMHVAEVAVSVVRSSSPSSEPLILTTDELLPLVAWCFVVLDPPSLKANCEYMRECLPKGVGPTGWFIHTFFVVSFPLHCILSSWH